MNLKNSIRVVDNFPKEGISFKDITTLLHDPETLREAIDQMAKIAKNYEFDYIIAAEARGFVLGTPLAYVMNKGFIPVRKPGKLPADVIQYRYDLEYGSDLLEIHRDALKEGDRILIVDDLLATGGTSRAMIELCEQMGAEVVACLYLIELEFLQGREQLKGYTIESLIPYEE